MTVKQVQHLLGFLGFYQGTVDGVFGEQSRAALESFQRRFGGLEVDGVPGEKTQAALRKAVAEGMPENSYEDFWEKIQFFTREEFRCKCGRYCNGFPAEMKPAVVLVAERARRHFGRPGHISSGLRCPQHNRNVGGVSNSQHQYGEAVDLRIEGVDAGELLAYLQKQPEVRYAYKIDSRYVHFDIPKEMG